MKKFQSVLIYLCLAVFCLFFTSCFSQKESPLYSSEWIMENTDQQNKVYLHQLFLKADKTVTLQLYYKGSDSGVMWTGKYKMNGKKIVFDFDRCATFDGGEITNTITETRLIKYYSGEFLYSTGKVYEPEPQWQLELIRPKNYFYGENSDFFGNPMGTFIFSKHLS